MRSENCSFGSSNLGGFAKVFTVSGIAPVREEVLSLPVSGKTLGLQKAATNYMTKINFRHQNVAELKFIKLQ